MIAPARWVGYLLAVGHAVGGSTWLARQGAADWWAAVAYLAAAAWLARFCWRQAEGRGTIGAPTRVRHDPAKR